MQMTAYSKLDNFRTSQGFKLCSWAPGNSTQPGIRLTTSSKAASRGATETTITPAGTALGGSWTSAGSNAALRWTAFNTALTWPAIACTRANLVVGGGQDEYYTYYDTLYELLTAQRGTLNSSRTGITGTLAEEDFTFDPRGN